MQSELAKATADKLNKDNRVESAEVEQNEKGVFVNVTAVDRMAARDLKGDLGEYPVYVEVSA